MLILKFFLHVSKKEQRKRFISRIDDPSKNWKFSTADLKEREFWNAYQKAYEDAISATSKEYAPWFVIPADDKWFARLAIATVISEYFEQLDLSYPSLNDAQQAELQKAKRQLMNEKGNGENMLSEKEIIGD
jgi:polyphosphate kinase 2 (PPK2 family)